MAYAVVASTSAGSANTSSVTTAGIDTTGANLLVLVATTYAGGGPTPTDSKGNTWTPLTRRGAGDAEIQLWYCASPVVGSGHTFTLSGSTIYPALAVLAVSGAAASPLDQQNGQVANAGATCSPGSVTPTEDDELVVSGYSGYSQAISSIDSGFTLAASVAYNGNFLTTGVAYLIQTSAAAANPTWTLSGSNFNVAAIASFKVAAAGGASIVPLAQHLYRQRR